MIIATIVFLKEKIIVLYYDETHVDIVGGGEVAIILCCVCGIRVFCGCVVSCQGAVLPLLPVLHTQP